MTSPASSERPRAYPIVLGLLCLLLLVLSAWRPMGLPDEARYGEIGRWMVQSGDWLTPRLNGLPFFHKPPYLYWWEATSIQLFGPVLAAVRLVPIVHALLMLGMLFFAARRFWGEAVAWRASIMLASGLGFLIGGQYVNHDMVVASWISTAIWCFALAFESPQAPSRRRWAWAGFVACALGLMTKGLIGVVLPGLALLGWLVASGHWRQMLRLPWFTGLALFALVAVPWFVLAERAYPGSLAYLFWTQQFGRFTGQTFNNARGAWFYWAVLVVMMFPWSLLVVREAVASVRGLLARWRGAAPPPTGATIDSLPWIWVLAIVGFFSIPTSKLVGYVLPVLPAWAVLAARGWDRWIGQKPWHNKALTAGLVVAVLLASGLTEAARRYTLRHSAEDVAQVLRCEWRAGDHLYAHTEYPYDLPFHMRADAPMTVAQDWPELRRSAGDNWRRELFEGADFDAQAARVLALPGVLDTARQQAGSWLALPREDAAPEGWSPVFKGLAWNLYRSTPERPESAEHKGLPGCDHNPGAHSQR